MNARRSLADMLTLLEEIENGYPVAEWRADGRRAWPFVRVRLGYGFTDESSGINRSPPQIGPGAIVREAGRVLAAVPRGARALVGQGAATPEAATVPDVAFFSDGASFLRTRAGVHIDRHCDPLRRLLREQGHHSWLFVPGHAMPRPVTPPAVYVQPRLDRAKAWARLPARGAAALPEFDAVRSMLRREGLEEHLPEPPVIAYAMRAIDRCAEALVRLLCDRPIRAGLVVSYYSLQSMAFIVACRTLGIPSIDLQHGLQGSLHFAYGRWRRVPVEGYDLLPRYFWAWSDEEAAVIDEWREDRADHEPIVGGNPLMHEWRTGSVRLDDYVGDATGDLLARAAGAACSVLWTMHGFESTEELRHVARIVADSPETWFWWLRCHPLRPERASELAAELTRLGVQNADVFEATRLPLFGLLQDVAVHITGYSSVVIEAERFGVPSVIVHPIGAEIFGDRISAGTAVLAPLGAEDLVAAVERQVVRRSRENIGRPSHLPGLPWLLRLLEDEPQGPPEASPGDASASR